MSNTSLPPHLERFVREQIAAGRYHSEAEVIRAALQLLDAASAADEPSAPRSGPTATGSTRRSVRPARTETWVSPGAWRAAAAGTDRTPAPARRSPRGLLADLRSGISFDDVRDARRQMWAALGRGPA